MKYYSRLERQQERSAKRQAGLLIVGSIVVLVLFIMYGFPAILNLTSVIGNLRGKKISSVTEKGVIPLVPRLAQDFEATKSAQMTLSGVADPKTAVEIFQNEKTLGTTVSKDNGLFSMEVDLSKGANIFTAVAISESGQKSSISDSYIVYFLNSPPKLEILSSKDGIITGKSDANTTVTINDHQAIVKSDGSFSYSLNLNSGDNKIKIVATDRAGNQKVVELTLSTATP